MPLLPATCPLDCPDACGVLVETDEAGAFVRVRGNPAHPHSRGSLCGKTAIFDAVVNSPDRLRTPLLRQPDGTFAPVSWDAALDVIAERVAPLAGEDVLALYYAGNMGLVNRRYPMKVLNHIGAVETDGTICDDTSTAGYAMVFGDAIGPKLDAAVDSDVLLLWGCDARRTLQHFVPRIKTACERGATVVVIDVYRTDTMRSVEAWGGRGLIVRPGSDAALALALCAAAFEEGAADLAFLRDECIGTDELRVELESWSLARAAEITGLVVHEIERLKSELFAARAPFLKTGIGWSRRRNGGTNMRAVCTLAAVLGHADRLHYESFDHFGLAESTLLGEGARPAGAPKDKVSQLSIGSELESGRFRACFVWGHNPAVTLPDSNRVRAGLAREDLFLVVHELFLTETARLADVVLPATTFVEHTDVLRSYGHRVLHLSRKACAVPDEQKSNVDTFRALARRLGLPEDVWAKDGEELALEFLAASRERFTQSEYERLLAGEPVELAPRARPDRGTPSGKIELASDTARALGQPAVATFVPDDAGGDAGPFWLHPAPSIATHNSTYTHSERHAARAGRAECRMHPDDVAGLGAADGDALRIANDRGSITLPVRVTTDVPRGLVRVDGFPLERAIPEGVGVNSLTTPAQSDLGSGHSLYSARVDVTRAPAD
ncbi:MAG: molybdopterin-dependent oxidoreductase [bacterium]|nr:molybdopterin-dependent oxidoreductase [bacterium]